MANDQIVLINAQTAAVTAGTARTVFAPNRGFPVGIKSTGLAGSETVPIHVQVNGSWVPTGVALTATEPHARLEATGNYTVSKDVTAGAVTVVAD